MVDLLLLQVMPLKKCQWEDIKQKYGLADYPYEEVRHWSMQLALSQGPDWMCCCHGVHKQGIDTHATAGNWTAHTAFGMEVHTATQTHN